jgi:hypothetical protein
VFLDDRRRIQAMADQVYAVNLASHGNEQAFDMFNRRLRRDL